LKKIENHCVGCGKPCFPACNMRSVPVWYCDHCQNEFDPVSLYDDDGEDLCEECLLKELVPVSVREGLY
jgi:hypothetical protein